MDSEEHVCIQYILYYRYCIQCIQYKYVLSNDIFTTLIPELVKACLQEQYASCFLYVCVCVSFSPCLYNTNPNIFIFLATSVIYCECDGQQKDCGCDWCDWQQEVKVQVALKTRRLEDWSRTTERPQPPFKEVWQKQTSKPKKNQANITGREG